MNPYRNRILYISLGVIFVINCAIVYQKQYKNNEEIHPINVVTNVEIIEMHRDMGNTELNKATKVVFKLKNIGAENLVIEDVKVDCHCTVVDWEKKPIAPNKTTSLVVNYDNHIQGYFKRVIVVKANLPQSPLVFTFSGKTS